MTRFIAILSISALFLGACGGNAEPDSTADENAAIGETPAAPTDNTQDTADASDSDTPPSYPAPEGSQAGNSMIIGAEDAPLTIVEYASVTCPACAQFHALIYPRLKEEYIDTGKVRLEYREFPTNPQNLAYAGFYLARCAATDNGAPAYFAMINTLYERQREWAYGPTPGQVLENIAAQVGISREGLEQCFYREDVTEAVRNNVRTGIEEDEVRATPTLIVDGEPLDWDRSKGADGFIAAVERELAARQ